LIYDTIANFNLYKNVIPHQEKILQFIRDIIDQKIIIGSRNIEIDGDSVFALINRYQTKESSSWEAHKKYIDIQWMISGKEAILFANIDDLSVLKSYDEQNDYLLLEGRGDRLTLSANTFAIFFPEDAHQPGLLINESEDILKIVIKVKV